MNKHAYDVATWSKLILLCRTPQNHINICMTIYPGIQDGYMGRRMGALNLSLTDLPDCGDEERLEQATPQWSHKIHSIGQSLAQYLTRLAAINSAYTHMQRRVATYT